MEKAASDFLEYRVRGGEPVSAHCSAGGQHPCKFPGYIGLCHNPSVT